MFTLAWEPAQAATVSTYTLQQKNADGGWETVASGLTSPEYAFTNGAPEAEGTWTFRVSASNESPESEFSPPSSEVKVDETAPNAPAAKRLTRTGLRGRRWLVQGQRRSVVQLERRPEARQTEAWAAA